MIFGSLEPSGAQGYKQMNVIKKHSRWGLQQTMVTGGQSQVSKGWGLLRQALEIAENTCKKNCSAGPRSC